VCVCVCVCVCLFVNLFVRLYTALYICRYLSVIFLFFVHIGVQSIFDHLSSSMYLIAQHFVKCGSKVQIVFMCFPVHRTEFEGGSTTI